MITFVVTSAHAYTMEALGRDGKPGATAFAVKSYDDLFRARIAGRRLYFHRPRAPVRPRTSDGGRDLFPGGALAKAALFQRSGQGEDAFRADADRRLVTMCDDDLGEGQAALYRRMVNDEDGFAVALDPVDDAVRATMTARFEEAMGLMRTA